MRVFLENTITNYYKHLVAGLITSEECFNFIRGVLHACAVLINKETATEYSELVEQLKKEYRSTVYSPGRQLTNKERDILREIADLRHS